MFPIWLPATHVGQSPLPIWADWRNSSMRRGKACIPGPRPCLWISRLGSPAHDATAYHALKQRAELRAGQHAPGTRCRGRDRACGPVQLDDRHGLSRRPSPALAAKRTSDFCASGAADAVIHYTSANLREAGQGHSPDAPNVHVARGLIVGDLFGKDSPLRWTRPGRHAGHRVRQWPDPRLPGESGAVERRFRRRRQLRALCRVMSPMPRRTTSRNSSRCFRPGRSSHWFPESTPCGKQPPP